MATKKDTTKKKAAAENIDAVVYSQKGTKAGNVSLPGAVFAAPWNADLVHQVVVSMMANARAGTAHTKDRSEVSGGGKKPHKQKGTGRARHGSSRSPIWVGGGITFGPRSDKDYSKKINKKMRVKALYTVLSRALSAGRILFVDSLALSAMKTKDAAAVISNLTKVEGFEKLSYKKATATLLALPERDETVEKSFANIPGVTVTTVNELNALTVAKYQHVVLVNPEAAAEMLSAKMK